MSSFWSWYVTLLTLGNIVACYWLIRWSSRRRAGEAPQGEVTGHTWDEDLQEYNNPLPRWWLWLFYITIVFGFVYLALYPGLGSYKGLLGWTEKSQYEQEMAAAKQEYGPIFAKYQKEGIAALAADPKAREIGQRLFLNYCAQCHGSDAGGGPGFPNLTDNDWLYGGQPETIQKTILDGRNGVMPAWGKILGDEGVDQVAAYVESLSGRQADPQLVEAGRAKFQTYCVACHGADGKGNQALGAPNLTDNTWLYGGSPMTIKETIRNGRQGHMPAHRDFLGEAKVHLLAAYVYSLSAEKKSAAK
ncbi:MAG TPA: cytochrome-c oxidase, cbb3-type subunit III [Gammaproteobacteria bacterium]|nr:cytochrome-c oxidase, cbb3-type subunit III [Gammaproteobacteria bacterium]